jgi:hypothetical protein
MGDHDGICHTCGTPVLVAAPPPPIVSVSQPHAAAAGRAARAGGVVAALSAVAIVAMLAAVAIFALQADGEEASESVGTGDGDQSTGITVEEADSDDQTTTTAVVTEPSTSTTASTTTTTTTTAPVRLDPQLEWDLGLDRPIRGPGPCDERWVLLIASVLYDDDRQAGSEIAPILAAYPEANYFKTAASCRSFRWDTGEGDNPSPTPREIYSVYYGPFATETDALAWCSVAGRDGANARLLSNNTDGPLEGIPCG